jgi:hypothetical protein
MLFLVMVLSLATVEAQVQFGIKAGPSFSTFSGSDATGAKLLFGFHGGVFAKLPINDQFSVQPEVQYSTMGAKGTAQDGLGNNITVTQNNNYLSVPILFTFTHSSGLILQTGPHIDFLMSSNAKANGASADTKKDFKSMDVGWETGIGYLSPANVGFIFRYGGGWLNVENNSNTGGQGSIHNVNLQLSVFYLFGGSERD